MAPTPTSPHHNQELYLDLHKHCPGCDCMTRLSRELNESLVPTLTRLEIANGMSLTELPPSLQQMVHLQALSLHGLPRLARFPQELCQDLNHLKELHICNLEVLQHLPVEFGNLTELKRIKLELVPMSSPLAPSVRYWMERARERFDWKPPSFGSLGQLVNLEELSIESGDQAVRKQHQEELTETQYNLYLTNLAESIEHLDKLGKLTLHNIPHLSEIPPGFLQLTSLTELNLSNLPMEGLPSELSNLTPLTALRISNLPIVSLPESMQQLVHLEELSIEKCHEFSDLPALLLESWPRLKRLRLSNLPNLTSLPTSLKHLSQLEQLGIRQCPRLCHLPHDLCQLTSLKQLYLWRLGNGTQIHGSLEQLSNLESMVASYDILRTQTSDIPYLLSLRKLAIAMDDILDIPKIEPLLSNVPSNVRELHLVGDLQMDATWLQSWLDFLLRVSLPRRLQKLDFGLKKWTNHTTTTNQMLLQLVTQYPYLRDLGLGSKQAPCVPELAEVESTMTMNRFRSILPDGHLYVNRNHLPMLLQFVNDKTHNHPLANAGVLYEVYHRCCGIY